MGTVSATSSNNFFNNKKGLISSNVHRNDWMGFLDALGWMEGEDKYNALNNLGYTGRYQFGLDALTTIHFLDGLGKNLFGLTTKSELLKNPIAQELAAIMEFSGTPNVGNLKFTSQYTAVRTIATQELSADIRISKNQFDGLIGKTFTIHFTNPSYTDSITLTKAGISSAAHLVGMGTMANAMASIYNQCFDSNGQQIKSDAQLPADGYADGNNVAFTVYVKLLQNYDISTLLNTTSSFADFNALITPWIAYQKNDLLKYINDKHLHINMLTSSGYTNTIRAVLEGLNLPADRLNQTNGNVIIIGSSDSSINDYPMVASAGGLEGLGIAYDAPVFGDYDLFGTDQNDLVFLGKGVDTFHGNGGDDVIYAGDDSDTVYGDVGDDFLIGEAGTDHLYGGAGDDTLFGMDGYGTSDNGEADYLYGGADYDTYIAGDGDTISDDDGKGMVTFEGDILKGGTLVESHELYDQYEGDGGTYYLLKTSNTLIYQKGEQFLTIENYHKEAKSLGITLDDEMPELTIIGHMANENDGTVTGKVVLTQSYARDITVHLSTLDDSAHAGEDYVSDNNITVTIHAGETEGDFSVNLIDNQLVEGRETLFTQIDNVTDSSGQKLQYTIKDVTPLTIEDDDGLNVSIFAPVVQETAGIATGVVTINKTYDTDLTFTLYTQDDSALSGGAYPDYVANHAIQVTIAAGSTYAEFNVGIVNDDKPESTETFYALVQSVTDSSGNAVEYTLVDVQPFTIEDDDSDNTPDNPTDPHYVTISVSDAQAVESAGTMNFVVSLSEVLSEDISIDFITTDGTAITGSDYIQYGRYGVTIAAGQRSAVYQVVVLNDEAQEPTETFSLTPYSISYSGSENVLLSNSATGTIYDDDDPQYVTAHISSASAKEAAEHMSFTVSLSHELERDITIDTSLGAVTIKKGDISGKVSRTWTNDTKVEPDETFVIELKGHNYQGGQYQVLLVNTSTGTIIDDDPEPEPHPFPYNPETPQPHDPLVLDLNQDGKISTIALADSQIYFDLTGDGVKERVGWIAPQDGLLVYDKNMNGKIDGIGEVFGKDGISGFAELRAVADTNYDNIIDRRDALFSQLKVWQDLNQDGISQSNELKSLSEAGVKNIELNVIGTNINLNGNLLSEAGRYGDSAGDRELAADIQLLATERVNSSNTPNTYEIDPITETLPQMRGYGYVDNSFKAYNLDPKLKELALTFMNDKESASANFGEFILRWSGFYDMAKSKGISEASLSPYLADHSPIKLWILERFVGSKKEAWRSEAHLGENTNGGYHTQTFGNEAYITDNFNLLMERYEAMFAIQAYYGDVFSDTHYDISIDEFVIDDGAAFTAKLTEYLNNATVSQSDKLYLASMMNNLEGMFLHVDAKTMIDSITDTTLKATVSDIMDEKVHFQFAKDSGIYSYANSLVYGDNSSQMLTINSSGAVSMIAGGGDDIIRDTASGATTYIYRRGDGADTIYDAGGVDTLKFEDITLDDVNIEVKNTNLIITLKSDPTDQITIVDWKKLSNRIETIQFAGENQVDLNELLFPKTEGDDYIELTNGDDSVDALGGNDTVYAGDGHDFLSGGAGNDTLLGGSGNDTYIFNRGDGKDLIIDSEGNDTLRFGDGIMQNELIVKIVGADMLIALKEEGKALDELSDVITVKNWTANATNRIETITLSDGTLLAIEALQSISDGNDTLFYGNTAVNLDLSGGDDTVTTGSGADTISGGSGNDTINSGAGNDILSGNEGDDILVAGEGNDTLIGGVGNDSLQGGLGDDLYLYRRGDGKDTIIDEYRYGYNNTNQSNAGNDTLRFGEGVTTADLIARISGDDLILALKEEGKTFEELGDVITIKNWVNTASRIETISLSDDSIVDLASIQSATEGDDNLIFGDSVVNVDAIGGNDTLTTGSANDVLHGGEGADMIRSQGGDDTLYGDAGNDVLYTGIGNDTLSGGEGADILYGENGNDILSGNGGNDTLVGGLGNDTYLLGLGDGHDTIIDEYSYGSGGNDTLRFGEGITVDNLVARAVSGSNDLQIGIRESGKGFDALSDVITLKNWFDSNKRIENFVLYDGTAISLSQMQGGTDGDDYLVFGDIDTTIDAMGGNDTVITGSGNDTLDGNAGNDILISNAGNDTLRGGEGNDTLKVGDGTDTLSGGIGADVLEGGAGNDTYLFGIGDGKDRITDSSGLDTLIFEDGITADNLVARVVSGSDDLQIALREDGKTFDQLSDVITISGWRNAPYRIENLRLSDDTAIALTQIERSSEGDDYLVFGDEGVIVDALGGNDTLITGDGADTLKGGAGNDTILSSKGNDTLSGGGGSDTLKGGSGNDTYLFNRGDGADTIFDELGNDILTFGEGITKDDLIFKQQGNTLLIGIAEVNKTFEQLSDVITITDWFKSETNIESIIFADNTSMNQSDIAGLFVANNISGALYSKSGAIMYGGSGDNTYVYNRGDFAVVIDDQYQQGQIDVNAGDDTLYLSGGINKSDVTFGVVGNDLILKITPKVDTYEQLRDYVVIKNWSSANRGVEKVIFSNGETITIDKNGTYPATTFNYGWVSSQYLIYGDDVNTVAGSATDETFETNGGNDIINAGTGNDRIDAGDGNDTIEGNAGNDVITMGAGNDTVTDSAGNDVYKYTRGYGNDTIYDLSGTDTLIFGEGITQEDLIVKQVGSNLVVGIRDKNKSFDELNDKLTIRSWFDVLTTIESFRFSDGTTLVSSDIYGLLLIDNSTYLMITENFENGAIGWSNNTTELASELTRFLGRFGNTDGNELISKIYGFGVENAGKQITIEFDMYEVGSWDGEAFKVFINEVQVVNETLYWDDHYGERDGGTKTLESEFGWGRSDIHHLSIESKIGSDGKMRLGFGSALDSIATGIDDESFGIDNITIYMDSSTYSPPLILDLNANGKTSVSLTDSHTYFDYTSDGLKEHTAWIERGDALLVRDINNDGVINDGSELFGDRTKISDGTLATDGYSALAQHDTNNDSVIDKNDADFAQLKFWKDANQNGKTDAGELVDLSVAGITSLSLNRADGSVYTQSTENGNIITNETNYTTLTDTGTMRDVWFKIDATDTITDNDTIFGTTDSETLSGDVGNDTYVIAYGGGADVIDDNGNGADMIKFLSGITADRLIVQWVRGSDDLRIGIRENTEDDTPITELSHTLTIKNWFNESGAIEQFSFSDGTILNRQGIYDLLLDVEGDLTMRVLDADGSLSGNSGNDVLYGVEGNERLGGKEGDDYLRGLAGDDYLSGGVGDDTLEGGTGNDTLEGGINDDYYLFDKGDGKDLIIDAGGFDTLYFGNGINSRGVIINEVGEDLVLSFGYDAGKSIGEIDQITIKNWNIEDFKIESLSFSDGKEYSISKLIEKNINHTPEMFFKENGRKLGKERRAKGILLTDDIDGDTLTYTVTSAPTMGTISIDIYGIWTYTGTSRDAGTDTVGIAISDGRGGKVVTALNFTMEALNQAPEAPSEISNTLQDVRIFNGNVGATDIDGDVLSYTVSTQATHGTFSIDEQGEWSYSATDGYMGVDSAVIMIDDGNGGVIEQTLSFDVRVSTPTLSDSTSSLLEDTASHGVFDVTNPIGGALTYEVLTASAKGTFGVNEAGEWSYTPSADLNGLDSVTINVTNAYGLSTTATLNLSIEAVNDAPILTETPPPVALYAGASTTGAIKASDIDGDLLSYGVTSNPEHGTLVINENGEWTYSAELYYAGESSATITIDDGHGESVATTLDFTNIMTPDWHYTYSGQTMNIHDGDGIDTLMMDNVSMADLTFLQEGNNLRIDVKDKNDVILTDYFTSITAGVEFVQSKEGTINLSKEKIGTTNKVWNFEWGNNQDDLVSGSTKNNSLDGGKGDDILFGNEGNDILSGHTGKDLLIGGSGNDDLGGGEDDDILYGDNGNDTLNGDEGNDMLFGAQGNDKLIGGDGNDLLNGGKGNNTLGGGIGNDTYLFAHGANRTTIRENVSGYSLFGQWFGENGGYDTVTFSEGITKEDISFLMKGNDLLLQYGENEFIAIINQKSEGSQIEKFELCDGSYLNNTDIDKIIQQINTYAKDNGFHLKDNTQIQNNQALMNIIASGWHQ